MGQQQLLLIVLGVIIVGLAVVIRIKLFQTNSLEHKRDLLINEGMMVAGNAIEFYNKPKILGGGSKSFADWEVPAQMQSTGNGVFTAQVMSDWVEIIGTGNEIISGSQTVEVKFVVTAIGIETEIIH